MKNIYFPKQKLTFLLFALLIGSELIAQKAYFQQEVDYKIVVSLDDKKHILSGTIEMDYHNNAPAPLSILYVLLQPNAYKSKNSAFAKQELRNGSTRFYFAESAEMGNLSNLNFEVDGKKVEVEVDKSNPDIAKVKLNTPILSGKSIKITTPFTYKIPFPFSRGGHAGQQYLMTQWYPRPAVYDAKGWHPQPYLDQGEFYQEFGSFDVSITLPENYVVGATGVLQTPSEVEFLKEKAKYTEGVLSAKESKEKVKTSERDSFPPSAEKMKTIRYTADKVIDFAWFADKRFLVQASETKLKQTGRIVKTYTYFPPKYSKTWSKSIGYINRAVQFYSDAVGDYPHPQASAVMSDEGFGGGMEYPMITVLSGDFDDRGLDGVITHEVGHNWFQGILASNERDFPWLDEGLNSYYDHRYDAEYYGNQPQDVGLPKFLTKGSDYGFNELGTHFINFTRQNQAPNLPSDQFTSMNYGLSVYEKTAQSLKILERHVGREKFDQIMQGYFKKWQFKHPQPEDFKQIWLDEAATAGDVSWFFDGLIGSTKKVDYKIEQLIDSSTDFWRIKVKNVGEVATPFTVSLLNKRDSIVYTTRLSPLNVGETTEVLVPKNYDLAYAMSQSRKDWTGDKYDQKAIVIDAKRDLPDLNRQNNAVKLSGAFKTVEPLRVSILPRLDNSLRTNFYATPILGANVYDGLMLGMWFNNGIMPLKKWEWSLAPTYAIRSKTLSGLANLDYHMFAGRSEITLGLGARRFSFDFNDKFKEPLIYERYTPSVSINFGANPTSPFRHKAELRHIVLREQGFAFDTAGIKTGKEFDNSNITQLIYSGILKNALGNTSFRIAIENQNYTFANADQNYLKTTLELKKDFVYQKGKRLYTRLFVGGFLKNTGREAGNFFGSRTRGSLGLVNRGLTDYRYDGLWIGRNEETGLAGQQIDPTTEGGMKFALPAGNPTEVGFSNSFVASLNLSLDLPVNLPSFLKLKPYFDLGYFDDTRPTSLRSATKTLMSGGIQWSLLGDAVSIYVPVYFSGKPLEEDPNSFKALMSKRTFLERITFSLNLKELNPRKQIRRLAN
ncbi:MAG: M1 family metallopeptidase [Saprospiraceae bacterium]|nr:M1 family metallopeptidase [Saprospiraceae bacterium]